VIDFPEGIMTKPRLLFVAAACVLPSAVFTQVASAQGNAPVIVAAVTAATGPTGNCSTVAPAQTTFPPSAPTAWFDFVYTGGNAGDQFQIQWFQPNGNQYANYKFTQPSTGGLWCYQYNIAVLGNPPAGLPGTWTVKLIWNNSPIFSTQFAIGVQQPLLDNFTQDSSLNSTLWSANTTLMKAIAANLSGGAATLEVPNLSFSSAGMAMSGVNGAGQFTGIQSNQGFTAPFSTSVTVMGTVANGNPFYLELASADLTQFLTLAGNINPNNTGFYGINLNATGGSFNSLLYSAPAVNVLYTINVAVDVTGQATVTLSNAGGAVLGSQSGPIVGTGPLYLILSQLEGLPHTVGPNTAIWQQASVTPPGNHPAFFSGEVSLGSGVYYLKFPDTNVFGYYNYVASSIFYHYDLGYEAYVPGSAADTYLYDFTSGHWLYTSSTLFPYLYDFSLSSWLYYFPNTANPGHYTSNPRYFSNLTTGKIISM
jgi:hypothetical protein